MTTNDYCRQQTFNQRVGHSSFFIFAVKNKNVMAKHTNKNIEPMETMNFGPVFSQFEGKTKEAMMHLCAVKTGICIHAFKRDDIGEVDIAWGQPNDPKTGKGGYGLSHILTDHGEEIKDFNFDPIDFILLILNFGKFRFRERCIVESRLVILFQNVFEIRPELVFRRNIRAVRPLGFIAAELVYQALFYFAFQHRHGSTLLGKHVLEQVGLEFKQRVMLALMVGDEGVEVGKESTYSPLFFTTWIW